MTLRQTLFISACLLLCLASFSRATTDGQEDKTTNKGAAWEPTIKETYDAALFEPCEDIQVSAPSHFPKPTDKVGPDVVPIVQPTYGRHRSHVDAVLAYAEGYKLAYYMMFVETLRETGFRGDVVLAIAEERILKPGVEEYLKSYAMKEGQEEEDDDLHVVTYQVPLDCESKDGAKGRHVMPTGETDVFQMCRLDHVYGWKDDTTGQVTKTARDPRAGRVVATLRYEWYWIWSRNYNKESWLMLLDARDSFFQANPFTNVPRQVNATSGLLYFFGENTEATRLGQSRKNKRWLQNGYGEQTFEFLKDKPTICSGSTMGEQVAIETYLRAMVNEHDECHIKMTGSDQGFHNYLYYSSKLRHALTIDRIIVWEQGRGIINNMGALRTKTFAEWGIYNDVSHLVYNWDGSLSPVVHQFDRDKALHSYMNGRRHKQWEQEWEKRKEKKLNWEYRRWEKEWKAKRAEK